ELEQAAQRPAYEPTFRKPPALVSHISPEMATRFREAYQAEPYWRRRYEEADTVSSAWTPGRRYYKSENGLLFFLDADYLPRLCVPDALRDEVLLRAHEDPMETAHAG
ncbi:uncharacterized protein SCHCODRAFT_02468393, partial [Schizophyllum commune H4-8]|uniref:uncharacterized protein n=1 Tax=Schizophyllum commune (strain H4-8 / FGSC 9210) TaxID=578458 RepID=UPI002160ECA4